jgi:hypothetical protein
VIGRDGKEQGIAAAAAAVVVEGTVEEDRAEEVVHDPGESGNG